MNAAAVSEGEADAAAAVAEVLSAAGVPEAAEDSDWEADEAGAGVFCEGAEDVVCAGGGAVVDADVGAGDDAGTDETPIITMGEDSVEVDAADVDAEEPADVPITTIGGVSVDVEAGVDDGVVTEPVEADVDAL